MKFYDVFNGDADGICAMLQLRLAAPRDAILITGVKRDIKLLGQVDVQPGDDIVVADISLDANRNALLNALGRNARVSWFDHHFAGDLPKHPAFTAHIDTDPQTCTSLIVDRHLHGRFRAWAIVAAFGDNLDEPASRAAQLIGLSDAETELLRELGRCINYNAYGDSIDDLFFAPSELFLKMREFVEPREFMHASPIFESLRNGLRDDLDRARSVAVGEIAAGSAFAILPDESWSRRVVGTYANNLAQGSPTMAHAILVSKKDGYLVSIRAPASNPVGAMKVARAFESGGGREGAAGINFLPADCVEKLFASMRKVFGNAS